MTASAAAFQGSGTPDVRKHQVASGFLVEVGAKDKLILDLGSGSYLNLLATGMPHADLTKVCRHLTLHAASS